MAEEKGVLVTCDRKGCVAQTFRKYIGKGEADGGYTTWDKFEPIAEGWDWNRETGTLCPSCNNEYKDALEAFKKRKLKED